MIQELWVAPTGSSPETRANQINLTPGAPPESLALSDVTMGTDKQLTGYTNGSICISTCLIQPFCTIYVQYPEMPINCEHKQCKSIKYFERF